MINCIIVEDGDKAAERLEQLLLKTGHEVRVLAKLDLVDETVAWLTNNPPVDLIFLDVQLGDGLGFEIFDHIQLATPVVFTTSYDHYITRAFEVNSISYLLKPVSLEKLKTALDKYLFLKNQSSVNPLQVASMNREYQHRFLVRSGTALKPIGSEEIAWFDIQHKNYLFLTTKSGQQYLFDGTLEYLEARLDPSKFFRINRKCIINLESVVQVNGYDESRRLLIETKPLAREEMAVSRHRVHEFKQWLIR